MLHRSSTSITTNSGGEATAYIGTRIRGKLLYLKYTPGTIDTGADLTITAENAGTPILTKADAGTSVVFFYPRALPNAVADGAAGTVPSEPIPIVDDRIKVVVAQGGNTATGAIEAVWETDPLS